MQLLSTAGRLKVPMWSPGMSILSYFLLFAMLMDWVSGDCYLYILQKGDTKMWEPSWSWSYGSWINNYLCNQCLSPLKLRVRIPQMARYTVLYTTLCDWVCQWFATGLSFSPGTPISSTNKTDRHIFNWNIVESGIKLHNNNLNPTKIYVKIYIHLL